MATNYPKLIITAGPDEGKEFDLSTSESFLIGRSDENDIILDDSSLSRRHASVHIKDNTWLIRDEGSRNQTFVNDSELTAAMSIPLNHLDLIKLGIYEMRFVTQEFTQQDIDNHKPAIQKSTPKPEITQDPEQDDKKEKKDTQSEIEELEKDLATIDDNKALVTNHEELKTDQKSLMEEESELVKQKNGKSLLIFTIIALFFCIVGLIIFFTYNHMQSQQPQEDKDVETYLTDSKTNQTTNNKTKTETTNQKDITQNKQAKTKTSTKENKTKSDTDKNKTLPEKKPEELTFTTIPMDDTSEKPDTKLRNFNVILDIKTEPMPATIYFKNERLCMAPCRQSISAKAGESYTIYADYDLRELNDIYRKKVTFKVKPDTDVLELKINAELGSLKVLRLPRRIDFYLEGYYDYDKLKANPAKIHDVTYGKPIYLPYGKYIIELKEKTHIASSDNKITQLRYQREHIINKANPIIEMSVTDRDLQFFPAVIKSTPPHADVFYGNEKVGSTPYTGLLPLGPNQIKVTKEGFFATVIDIDMRMNSIYETTVELKTSKMGELINEAKEEMRNEQFSQALDTLINALKFGGSLKEKAEVYYLLGAVYNSQKNYDQAVPYLERAKEHKDFYKRAGIELVRSYHGLKQKINALKLIVEILSNIDETTPSDVRQEANSIFKLISPVKSVMYIYSEPAGATVFLNDKIINQATPLILSDMGLANYRIQIEKPGYKTYKTKQNVKIGEFVLIKVRLTKEVL